MARGINKVILVGNLGQDPDAKYAPDGMAISTISLATSQSWKDRQTGEQKEKTEWHRVVFYKKLAEVVAQHLKKGSKVYLEGSLRTRKWQDKSGADRYTTEIVAKDMQMLDSRPDGAPQNPNVATSSTPKGYSDPAAQNYAATTQGHTDYSSKAPDMDTFDDDIPF